MIEDYHVGGVILYDRNMVDPKQVTQLTNDLQGLAEKSSEQDIPLMISVDQEGGSIVRMKEHVSPHPLPAGTWKKREFRRDLCDG